jgi:anthranilate synthase/aminodeoxychorismate synthase-like glutamine amidotransferase
MILLVDHYDSFVYNLARYVRELGEEALVRRHDAITLDEIARLEPSHIILSPGPCTPAEVGISVHIVRRFGPSVPVLGVCLGHQCIGVAFGGRIVRAQRPMHGKASAIRHDGRGIFLGLPSPLAATRYHSLVIEPATIPPELTITALSDEGEIMGVEHRRYPVIGVQFHPESALSEYGYHMLDSFLHGPRPSGSNRPALPAGADGRLETRRPPAGEDSMDSPGLEVAPPPAWLVH